MCKVSYKLNSLISSLKFPAFLQSFILREYMLLIRVNVSLNLICNYLQYLYFITVIE